MLEPLLAFLPALVVTTLVPGLNNVFVLRTAVEAGPAPAAATAAGASTGILAWSTAGAVGVGGLVLALPGGIDGIRVAGAALMVGMGLWGLVPRAARPLPEAGRRGFATGLAVCLANPRTPVGALALLPQYAVPDAAVTSTVLLGATWAVAAGLWNLLCIRVVTRRRPGPGGSLVVQRVGAVALVTLGVVGLAGA